MIARRTVLKVPAAAAASARAASPATLEVRQALGKPTLFLRGKPVHACFYALTDCPGGRFSFEEGPRTSIERFVRAGFRLFQLDLFLEECWTQPGPLSIDLARRQIRGILDLCPDASVVLRWHLNAPEWWKRANPSELTRYANGDFEKIERTLPVRIIQDDLRRAPRVSLASELWFQSAREKTVELLRGLSKTAEGGALGGIHVACGVYGEWHYWGFMRNEPDVSEPMQQRFAEYRKGLGKPPVPVPGVEARRALDDGIFRDPARRSDVIDYYRCQQALVASRMIDLCSTVKRNYPRPLLTGTFYGYFFSMFDRHAAGGHLCLHDVLSSPGVDYLSAPQAYGGMYRDPGSSGITRALIESVRLNGKLFLDEMDQTPSWKWQNNVDTAFTLSDVPGDISIIRRNVLESYTRGAGLWYYDFGPANQSGWWLDDRLMAEIASLKKLLDEQHAKPYEPAGDVLFVFDTEAFYYTGSIQGTDPFTDPVAVNRTITSAWAAGAALETIHLRDLEKIDLSRFKLVVFANTWVMTAAQRRFIRERVVQPGRAVVFQGLPGYCDGARLSAGLSREVTGLDLRLVKGLPFSPAFTVGDRPPGVTRHGAVWFATGAPPVSTAQWRDIFGQAGAHLYTDAGDIVHAGGGLVLIHSKQGGPRRIVLRSGRVVEMTLQPNSSTILHA
jgi:hypothetical protein